MAGVAAIDGAFAEAGVASAPWLGQVAPGADGMLQLVDPDRLLAPDVEALLFGEAT